MHWEETEQNEINCTLAEAVKSKRIELFEIPGNARCLTLNWPNGTSEYIHYSGSISGKYHAENGSISLNFFHHEVILKGRNLKPLLSELSQQKICQITCIEDRYEEIEERNGLVVLAIEIRSK